MRQKQAIIIGSVTFNMSSFEVTKNLSITQDFPVMDQEFLLGTLNMTLQLGCGRMYFGKEFVDFVVNNRKQSEPTISGRSEVVTSNTPNSSDQESSVIFVNTPKEETAKSITTSDNLNKKSAIKDNDSVTDSTKPPQSFKSFQINYQRTMKNPTKQVSIELSNRGVGNKRFDQNVGKENINFLESARSTTTTDVDNKTLLYGVVFVSEAQYFEYPIDSYFSCQIFCRGDTLCSRVVYNSKEPVFNFYQKVPFLLNDDFLLCMKDNSITVDFWERYDDEDIAIGTSQLSLHQFFIAYRDKVIADTLLQNHLPVTISDWWEPICSCVNGKIFGQMKVLVAVGTATQIQNLEVERGLKDHSLTVTYISIHPGNGMNKQNRISSGSTTDRSGHVFKRPTFLNKSANSNKQNNASSNGIKNKKAKEGVMLNKSSNREAINVKTIDIGTQADTTPVMEDDNKESQSNEKIENMLETFLTHLIEQKQTKFVENSTNTDNNVDIHNNLTKNINNDHSGNSVSQSLHKLSHCKNATNSQLKRTSDLLDYLNDALSGENTTSHPPQYSFKSTTPIIQDKNNFKAHIIVEGALHLPCRRKCKSKKARRSIGFEKALPSTYVTFETIPGCDLKVTPVVQRSSSPQWDFRCDVLLPGEILNNSQKRLIFKVWCQNNDSSQPNLQTDVVLGFAALDLTVLLAGLPSVQGWFNIVDFSSKCNGQIKIDVTPTENITRFSQLDSPKTESPNPDMPVLNNKPVLRATDLMKEEPSELLNRTLKRKFTELEEITQRLRSRLADVTRDDSDTSNDEFSEAFERDINSLCIEDDYNMIDLESTLPPQLSNGQNGYLLQKVPTGAHNNSNLFASAVEPSIYSKGANENQLCTVPPISKDSAYGSTLMSDGMETVSRPFVTATFSSSSSNVYSNTSSQLLQNDSPKRLLTPGDHQLISGKARIDTLLEKLTLLSGVESESVFPNRYVSGCSVTKEGATSSDNGILDDSAPKPASSFNMDSILDPEFFNRLCSFDVNSASNLTDLSERQEVASNAPISYDSGGSSTSLLTQFSTFRQAPDGAGMNVDASVVSKQNI